MMTSLRFVGRALCVLVLAAFASLMVISPASAHGGGYDIEFDQDGLGGINAFARYTEDGHMVDAVMDLTATATAADGRVLGPVRLVSSAEGQGVWVTSEPFLDQGVWNVTVATTQPHPATATKEIEVVFADQTPPEPTEDTAAAPTDSPDDTSTLAPLLIGGGVLALIAVVVAVIMVSRTRRAH